MRVMNLKLKDQYIRARRIDEGSRAKAGYNVHWAQGAQPLWLLMRESPALNVDEEVLMTAERAQVREGVESGQVAEGTEMAEMVGKAEVKEAAEVTGIAEVMNVADLMT